jgi:hypothetical protein
MDESESSNLGEIGAHINSSIETLCFALPLHSLRPLHAGMSSLPTSALELESSLYIGIILSSILYGVYLVVAGLSFTFLFKNANTTRSRKFFYVLLTFVLFDLNTLAFISSPLLGQNMWIIHRDDRGGPPGYYDSNAPDWYQEMGELAQTAANLLADVLLVKLIS